MTFKQTYLYHHRLKADLYYLSLCGIEINLTVKSAELSIHQTIQNDKKLIRALQVFINNRYLHIYASYQTHSGIEEF